MTKTIKHFRLKIKTKTKSKMPAKINTALTYVILLIQYAHMIMADHALFINHCTACFLFHVFPWIVHIHMYGKKSWSLCALCLMLLFCTCISHMGTNHHIVLVCFICVFIWKMWYLEHVQNATKSFLVDVRAIQEMLLILNAYESDVYQVVYMQIWCLK